MKDTSRCIHYFLKPVGNNASTSSPYYLAVTACFWYFNNNILSFITAVVISKFNISSIPMSTFQNCILFPVFLSVSKPRRNSNIKKFIENQLPININQIHGSVMVCSFKFLPPKIGGCIFLPIYAILDSSNLTITRCAYLV